MTNYIGLMSGTSMDGIDAALVSFEDDRVNLIATHSIIIPAEIKTNLKLLLHGENINLKLLGETDAQLGELFSVAVLELLKNTEIKAENITAIGSHGQTIYHSPSGAYPFTMQIGDPNIIAARTSITTVADFRRRDIALGGQGAPLVPAFHDYLFGREKNVAVLNLGGIGNVTFISHDKPVIGFDTGPANTLLDQWCEQHTGKFYDKNGDWARNGKLIPELLVNLLNDPYFQKPFPKSTGREYFNMDWLNRKIFTFSKDEISPEDIQNTLTELTVKTISNAITLTDTATLWLCGGGTYNDFLIEQLRASLPQLKIKSSSEIGIDPQWIESIAFAWLAKQNIEHKPGNLPSVTGAKSESILGGVYYK